MGFAPEKGEAVQVWGLRAGSIWNNKEWTICGH